jgi:hypothetical protein
VKRFVLNVLAPPEAMASLAESMFEGTDVFEGTDGKFPVILQARLWKTRRRRNVSWEGGKIAAESIYDYGAEVLKIHQLWRASIRITHR